MSNLAYKLFPSRRAVVTPHSPVVINTIRTAQTFDRNGKRYCMVPHRPPETVMLRRLGYDVPAPILSHYDWCGHVPFESQTVTASLMTTSRRGYILNGMGTGKTLATLFACDYLMREGIIKRALVIAPLSTLSTVWENEIFRWMPHRKAAVLHGLRDKRLKMLDTPVDFYIINHDGVSTILDQLCDRKDIHAVVLDELTAYRNKRSTRWKVVNALIEGKRYVWGLTGSPMPKEPMDAFGQLRLLTPNRVSPFANEFKYDTMYQVSQFIWLPKKGAKDYVFGLMQPSVRYSIEDCVDLPPTTYTNRQAKLTTAQKKAYADMAKQFVTTVGATEVEAANSGVQVLKLLQIASGFIYDEAGNPHSIDAGDRLDVLKDIITESDRKVIVFAPFKYTVAQLFKEIINAGWTAEIIHGGVPKRQRDIIFSNFQNTRDPQVLVAHPRTMSHGLTLTQANTIVWYSATSDLETYEQANARIVRPGQKFSTNIVHIQGGNIERRMYKTLQTRGNAQQELLNIFHEMTKGGLTL